VPLAILEQRQDHQLGATLLHLAAEDVRCHMFFNDI
jgi:hypothetical protein